MQSVKKTLARPNSRRFSQTSNMSSRSFCWADSSSEFTENEERKEIPPPPPVPKQKSEVSSLQGLSTGEFSPIRKPIQGLVDLDDDKLKRSSPKRGANKKNKKKGDKKGREMSQKKGKATNKKGAPSKGNSKVGDENFDKQGKKSPNPSTNSKRGPKKSPKQSKPAPTSLITRLEIT